MDTQTRNKVRMLILLGLLLLPIIFALFTAIDLEYSWLKKFAYLSVVLTLLAIPALFLKARIYFLLEGIFNFLFFPIDIASLYLNRQPTSSSFLQNIFETNFSEAFELIRSTWQFAIVVILLWGVYFVLAFRVENRPLFSRKACKWILGLASCLFVVGTMTMMVLLKQFHSERTIKNTLLDAVGLVWVKLYKIYPYNLYIESFDLMQSRHEQVRMQEQIASFHFGIDPISCEELELYVLVIGETARYDHFGINHYERNTTPLLQQHTNLISYDSAFSQANLTASSLPLLVSRATAKNSQLAYGEKSLPEAFQEAGFKTGWLTKQVPYPFVERIMDACDYSKFYSKGIDVSGNYDEELVSTLHSFTEDTLQFFVLHSLGCHFRYEQRYPKSFEKFQPTLGGSFTYAMISEANQEPLVNAYDNAILYTDFFLHKLINYLDSLNRPAVMLYMADHGESFWDDDRKLALHGSYQTSEYEYHVPLLIWYSEEYEAAHPEKVQAMRQNKTTPVSSDVVFYSMLDLAGIEDIVDSTRSICSTSLVPADTIWVITGSGSVEAMPIR